MAGASKRRSPSPSPSAAAALALEAAGAVPVGLRERKRQRTRAAIQTAALELFARRGYDATTCEQIAAAAEVSPATFFRYFPTKEDVVLADEYDDLILALLQDRPADESPVQAMRRSLAVGLGAIYETDADLIRARLQLVLSVPALRARRYEQQRATESLVAAGVAGRTGCAPSDLEARVVAAAIVAAVVVAVEEWAKEGGDLPKLVDRALVALEGRLTARRPRRRPAALKDPGK